MRHDRDCTASRRETTRTPSLQRRPTHHLVAQRPVRPRVDRSGVGQLDRQRDEVFSRAAEPVVFLPALGLTSPSSLGMAGKLVAHRFGAAVRFKRTMKAASLAQSHDPFGRPAGRAAMAKPREDPFNRSRNGRSTEVAPAKRWYPGPQALWNRHTYNRSSVHPLRRSISSKSLIPSAYTAMRSWNSCRWIRRAHK